MVDGGRWLGYEEGGGVGVKKGKANVGNGYQKKEKITKLDV